MDMDNREVNRDLEVGQGTDIRRGMIMARDVSVTSYPELIDNLAVPTSRPVEPFGTDLVHWGAVWGGFFTYLAITAILGALAVAIGAVNVNPARPGAANANVFGGVGIALAVIMLIATYVGGVLAGWTSNLRSRWPAAVNGLIYGSLVLTAPLLFTLLVGALTTSATAGAVAGAQAMRGGIYVPGALGLDPRTLQALGANVGWFSVGGILMLVLGALGYVTGMQAHLTDLGNTQDRTIA